MDIMQAKSGGYMVAFAGRKYAARSPPVFVADNRNAIMTFTLVSAYSLSVSLFSSSCLFEKQINQIHFFGFLRCLNSIRALSKICTGGSLGAIHVAEILTVLMESVQWKPQSAKAMVAQLTALYAYS